MVKSSSICMCVGVHVMCVCSRVCVRLCVWYSVVC